MQRRWRSFLVPSAFALCVVATACGGPSGAATDGVASAGGATPAKATSDKKSTDPQQAGLDFATCMREHGVDVPDPQTSDKGGMVMIGPGSAGGGAGTFSAGPPAGFEEADLACRHFLEDAFGDGPGPIDPKEQDRALKFAQCMREHGVDMPDPDFSGGGVRITVGVAGGAGPDQATMEAAQKACGSLFGPPGGAGGFRSGPVSSSAGRS